MSGQVVKPKKTIVQPPLKKSGPSGLPSWFVSASAGSGRASGQHGGPLRLRDGDSRRHQCAGEYESRRERYNCEDGDPQWARGHCEMRGKRCVGCLRRDYPTTTSGDMADSRPFRSALPAGAQVSDLIRFGAQEFERAGLAYGHGTDNPVDDAAALVFHVLDLDHDRAGGSLWTHARMRRKCRQCSTRSPSACERRVPAAYLMGRMWFAGLEFEVDDRVIVPRSPFAELIHAHFRPWIDPAGVRSILDIGTGSGCIAIACALAFPSASVDAVDVVVTGTRGCAPQRRQARGR